MTLELGNESEEYKKGYTKAIDDVMELCDKEVEKYAQVAKDLRRKRIDSRSFHYKELGLHDFKQLVSELFQEYFVVMEMSNE